MYIFKFKIKYWTTNQMQLWKSNQIDQLFSNPSAPPLSRSERDSSPVPRFSNPTSPLLSNPPLLLCPIHWLLMYIRWLIVVAPFCSLCGLLASISSASAQLSAPPSSPPPKHKNDINAATLCRPVRFPVLPPWIASLGSACMCFCIVVVVVHRNIYIDLIVGLVRTCTEEQAPRTRTQNVWDGRERVWYEWGDILHLSPKVCVKTDFFCDFKMITYFYCNNNN